MRRFITCSWLHAVCCWYSTPFYTTCICMRCIDTSVCACLSLCWFKPSPVFDFFALLSFFNSLIHFSYNRSLFHYLFLTILTFSLSSSSSSLSSYSIFFFNLYRYSKNLLVFFSFLFSSFSLGLYSVLICMCVCLWMKEGATSSESGKWEAPETFVRTTTKYWLKPDRVVRKNQSMKR